MVDLVPIHGTMNDDALKRGISGYHIVRQNHKKKNKQWNPHDVYRKR
jgi:hypothetical protein